MLILLALNSFSQNTKINQKIEKVNEKYITKYNGKQYDIDTKIITVKLQKDKNLAEEYNVVRKNKLGFVDILVPENKSIENFVNVLLLDSRIEEIEYSIIGKYIDFFPNDTERTLQWYLTNIRAYQAWDFTIGNPDVSVGVLDSGTDWSHSDLGLGNDNYQNIHLNLGEDIWNDPNNPSTGNGIDDDNNGLIDDWKGWNYANNSNDVRTTNPHGTLVAGIVSAKSNNSHGISGLAGGNYAAGVKILPYCIGINAPISALIDDAIIDAVDNGVRVIQLSLNVASSNAIDIAIQYAIDNNVVVICASGNAIPAVAVQYPASNNNVISVGGTNQNDLRANFSNFGNNLDIVAPGVGIRSTTLLNEYNTQDGTSFAAPQVSAIAALILSVNPNLTGQEVRNIIESTAQKVGGYSYTNTSNRLNGTWNEQMGYGLVDAYAAVLAAMEFIPLSISGLETICDMSTKTYTLKNADPNTTTVWQLSSNLKRIGASNTSIGIQSLSDYTPEDAWVSAFQQGKEVVTKNIWLNKPLTGMQSYCEDVSQTMCYLSGITSQVQIGSTTTLALIAKGNVSQANYTDWEWQRSSGNFIFVDSPSFIDYPINGGQGSLGKTASLQVNGSGLMMFKARTKNSCGWGDWKYFFWDVYTSSLSYSSVSSLEATGSNMEIPVLVNYSLLNKQLNVEILDIEKWLQARYGNTELDERDMQKIIQFVENKNNTVNVSIYNFSGEMVLNKEIINLTETISLSQLRSGIYFIKITIKGLTETKTIYLSQ